MIGVKRHCAWWKTVMWPMLTRLGLHHVAVACIVAIPPALYLHHHLAPARILNYDVQRLPFEPLIGNQTCVITIVSVENAGNVPLTGVEFTGEFSDRVHHAGSTRRGRASIRIDKLSSDTNTRLCVDVGRLAVGERVSVGVISTGLLANEPAVGSNEVVGTQSAETRFWTGVQALAVAVCMLSLFGTIGYVLTLCVRRARANSAWSKALAEYALENRRAMRYPDHSVYAIQQSPPNAG